MSEPIHAGIPHSKLVVIPEVRHMIDVQAPERRNIEVRLFVRHAGAKGVLRRCAFGSFDP